MKRYRFLSSKTNALHLAATNGNSEYVNKLLENGIDINFTDENNMTALQLAIANKHKSVIEVIINGQYWKESLMLDDEKTGNTPMKDLIRDYPELAEKVMDKCITEVSTGKDYELQGDVQFIEDDPKYNRKRYHKDKKLFYKSTKKHPLRIMIDKKHENLLKHPLCLMWIQRQWTSYARYMFAAEAVSYLLFLISLSIYSLESFGKYDFNTLDNSSTVGVKCETLIEIRSTRIDPLEINLIVWIGFNILLEIIQMQQLKKYYVNIGNFFDWILYILSIILLMASDVEERCFCWNRSLAAVLLVASWLNSLRYLRFFSFFGIFLHMFVNIFMTVFKLCLMMALFVLAFTFGFHLSLINKKEFSNFGWAYLKTLVMSSGEYEYDSVLREEEIFNAPIVIIIFIAMLVVMSIVLMNMLIGIAVDDISKVQQDAELQKIISQTYIALSSRRPFQKRISEIIRKMIGGKSTEQKIIKVELHLKSFWQWLFGMNHIMSDENILKLYQERKNIQKITTMKLLSDKIDHLQEEISTRLGKQEETNT